MFKLRHYLGAAAGLCLVLTILLAWVAPARAESYNAQAAVDYANKYYKTRNSAYTSYGESDCANFVSQCLVAGGMQTDSVWYAYSGAWKVAPRLMTFLQGKGYKMTLWPSSIDDFDKGDIVVYNGAVNGNNGHVGIVVNVDKDKGRVSVAMHSTDQIHSYKPGDTCVSGVIHLSRAKASGVSLVFSDYKYIHMTEKQYANAGDFWKNKKANFQRIEETNAFLSVSVFATGVDLYMYKGTEIGAYLYNAGKQELAHVGWTPSIDQGTADMTVDVNEELHVTLTPGTLYYYRYYYDLYGQRFWSEWKSFRTTGTYVNKYELMVCGSDGIVHENLVSGEGVTMGTCDVYINGEKVADDVTAYTAEIPQGSYYEIKDLRGLNGFLPREDLSQNLSGVVDRDTYPLIIYSLSSSMHSLRVSGECDDRRTATTDGYGTFDVYIGGVLRADDVTSFYLDNIPDGTYYEIMDIRPAADKEYIGYLTPDGSGLLDQFGYLYTNGEVVLSFDTMGGRLHVRGFQSYALDEINGEMNVYVEGELVAENVSTFDGLFPLNASYQIELTDVDMGFYYVGTVYANEPGCGGLSGVIDSEDKFVYLRFQFGNPWDDWVTADALPDYVDPAQYDIQYNNHYDVVASSSPGSGWTQGAWVRQEYQPSGSLYYSDIELETSDTRRLVSYYYYHYCGASMGNLAEHYMKGGYVHYDSILDVSLVTEAGRYVDDTMADYHYYILKWKDGSYAYCRSGVTCDGSNGTHGNRSYYWYKMSAYQDYAPVNYYHYTRESGWTAARDPSAAYTTLRYKMKFRPLEQIELEPLVEVTIDDYVYLNPAVAPVDAIQDDLSWWWGGQCIESVVNGVVTLSEPGVGSVTCSCWYNSDARADTLIVVHPKHILVIPEGVKVIESEAFAGDLSIEEVVFPSTLERVESGAFEGCENLKIIYAPDFTGDVAEDAFTGCVSFPTAICRGDSRFATLIDEAIGWIPERYDLYNIPSIAW